MFPKSLSIRTLLLLTMLLCIGLAIWTHWAKKQKRLVALLHGVGARVSYDYVMVPTGAKPGEPFWLSRILGQDYFHHVACVNFQPKPPQEADELIRLLDDASNVSHVAIWPGSKGHTSSPETAPGGLTDEGQAHLVSKHPGLVHFSLLHARLSPASIARLMKHPTLVTLQID